jgi:hypothetical protein
VSCVSATACVAVGDSVFDFSGDTDGVPEGWNGSSWAIQTTPFLFGASNSFTGVSCTSSTVCTVVGSMSPSALAEGWDGTSWSIQPTPNPAGATQTALNGVSCTSERDCIAVGSFTNSAGNLKTLAERSS